MSSEQDVRASALNAAVLHHKTVTWNPNDSTRFQPKVAAIGDVLATAHAFEQFIQGDEQP